VAEQRPDDACVLCRDSDAGAVVTAAFTDGEGPAGEPILTPPGSLQHGPRTEDQQGPQVRITPSSDVSEPGLPAGRVLPRNQSEPGRELPAVGELVGVANARDDGRCAERPDAVERLDALGARIAPGEANQLPLVVDYLSAVTQ